MPPSLADVWAAFAWGAVSSAGLVLGAIAGFFFRLSHRWAGAQAAERANFQSYLIELCDALGVRLLREKIGALSAIKSTRTTIVLETGKESMTLPIGVRSSGVGA
jgi:hypothetical protein